MIRQLSWIWCHTAAVRTCAVSTRTLEAKSVKRSRSGPELLIRQQLLHKFEAGIGGFPSLD